MITRFIRFIIGLLFMSVLIVVASVLLFSLTDGKYYLSVFPWLLLFFFLITAGVHFFHLKAQQADAGKFPRYSLAVNGIKIFCYMIVILLYIFLQRESAVPFLFGFFALYLFFSIYEVVALRKSVERKEP